MQENKAQIPFYTSPKERGTQLGKTGPKREENKAKPKSNRFIFARHPHGPTQEARRSRPIEDGAQRPQWGCGHTPCGPVQAQTSWVGLYHLSKHDLDEEGGKLNAKGGLRLPYGNGQYSKDPYPLYL